jgi:hypothetical protein
MIYQSKAAETYTVEEFINMQQTDQMTFRNFSLFEVINDVEIYDHNLIEDYLSELDKICLSVSLSIEEQKKYKYFPDLLAYDIYGSTQLDFVILFANGIADPKEFDMPIVKVPIASQVKAFLNSIYNANRYYIESNKVMNGLSNNVV